MQPEPLLQSGRNYRREIEAIADPWQKRFHLLSGKQINPNRGCCQ